MLSRKVPTINKNLRICGRETRYPSGYGPVVLQYLGGRGVRIVGSNPGRDPLQKESKRAAGRDYITIKPQ